ncbi:hypothetical protein H6G96_27565 [Nostoc sp. FACHB-892]|uniref:hypothetical protein n=1 Tax=Nostoc sp. FACHB-892 TaxID=2692843 RepID=UPI001682E146|nr:hypothetical protein [Nostoc sp. FACHB-892]MBD2729977.1 hypothetical protein [Nostoc sp. FACHB-892]
MSNSTVQSQVKLSKNLYIPVREVILKKILVAMESLGIVWDGSINHIDDFCWSSATAKSDWLLLSPSNNHKRVVYVQYLENTNAI